jgi:hypothetical protein
MKTSPISHTSPWPAEAAAHAHPSPVDLEIRNRMIAEAAYYRAEARGFATGYELEDWLEAEAEIDQSFPPSALGPFED